MVARRVGMCSGGLRSRTAGYPWLSLGPQPSAKRYMNFWLGLSIALMCIYVVDCTESASAPPSTDEVLEGPASHVVHDNLKKSRNDIDSMTDDSRPMHVDMNIEVHTSGNIQKATRASSNNAVGPDSSNAEGSIPIDGVAKDDTTGNTRDTFSTTETIGQPESTKAPPSTETTFKTRNTDSIDFAPKSNEGGALGSDQSVEPEPVISHAVDDLDVKQPDSAESAQTKTESSDTTVDLKPQNSGEEGLNNEGKAEKNVPAEEDQSSKPNEMNAEGEIAEENPQRKKYLESLQAEQTLIKDTLPIGRPNSNQEASPEENANDSQVDTHLRDLMDQANKCRVGSKLVKQDYSKAFELCKDVAERGGQDGVNCLGEFFKFGLGRPKDIEQAVQYFRAAASTGHPAAQRNLAVLYSTGHGVPQNTALAVLYYHFAAVAGDHLAQLAMGYRHMHGVGVPKNCQTAMEFYMPAAEFVVKEVHNNRAQAMIEKQSLSSDATKPKSMELDEDVVNYYAYSADRGDASAQVALGQLYFTGSRGLQQDYAEAFRWYLRAAEQGDANAMGHLGNMYAQGVHVQADNQTALNYFRKGVEKGNALALNGLGFMSMYGMGVLQSYDDALKSFTKAAEQGNQEARFNLGALHVGGYGVPKDYAKAIYYFTLAANRGHMLALYNLAMMHHNGFGTPRSCPNAVQFIKSVVERGEWAGRLQWAYRVYGSGDSDGALLAYLEMAEFGFDIAQANAAHIFDEERTSLARGRRAQALRLYELSAQQGNMAAELKIGDYYYHGWGTPVNYRKAVAHYRAASEARVAQAMFNLGWMHEQGRGVSQDRHLAKRFYDMASEASAEAAWPAGICLARLAMLAAGEALVQRIDTAVLALNMQASRYGLKFPMSQEWVPKVTKNWDLFVMAAIAPLLAATLMLRALIAYGRQL